MATYVLRRLIQAIPILIGISIISFLIINLAPGDPTDRFRSGRVSAETIQNLIRLYGLDKPLLEQFVSWFTAFWSFPWNVAAWGYSFVDGRPVTEKVFEKIPPTLELMGTALIVTMIVSIPLGRPRRGQAVQLGGQDHHDDGDRSATPCRRSSWASCSCTSSRSSSISFPLVRAPDPRQGRRLRRLPLASLPARHEPGDPADRRLEPLHALLDARGPPAGLRPDGEGEGPPGSTGASSSTRCKNALLPIITLLGLTLPSLLAGAAITETIFSWPGLGYMAVQSVTANDFPVILAIVMIGGMMVILGNLLADVLYGLVDPRIKY